MLDDMPLWYLSAMHRVYHYELVSDRHCNPSYNTILDHSLPAGHIFCTLLEGRGFRCASTRELEFYNMLYDDRDFKVFALLKAKLQAVIIH